MARPRSVPEGDALERALLVFWEHGYDRTSISDLCKAIGVGPSSIYNAFGSKEALYRRALEHYMGTHANVAGEVLASDEQQDAGTLARSLLRAVAKLYTAPGLPGGCALFQSAGASAPSLSEASAVSHEFKLGLENAIQRRFQACARAGDELAASPRVLAQFVLATMRGLSQLATDGATRRDLLKVADHAAASCLARTLPSVS